LLSSGCSLGVNVVLHKKMQAMRVLEE